MLPTLKRPNMLLFALLLAPFIKPVGVDAVPFLDKLFAIWKLAALAYLALALLPKLFRPVSHRKTAGYMGLGLFWLIYIFGSLHSGVDVVSITVSGVSCLLLLLLIDYETQIGNGMILLRAMSRLFTLAICAHIFSVVLVHAGVIWMGYVGESPVYLFGMDNYSAFFIYPMLTLVLYCNTLRKGGLGIGGWLLLLGVTGIYVFTKSLTAVGAGILMLGVFIVKAYRSRPVSSRWIYWSVGIMAALLVLICAFEVQKLLAALLAGLSKGVSLNSRTYIWEYALRLIKERPLLGYGTLTDTQLYTQRVLYGTSHAHNLLLELLLRTGIVGTVGYLVFLLGFDPFQRKKKEPKASGVLFIGLVGQLVLFFMDYYPTILVFYLFMGVLYCRHRFCPDTPSELPVKTQTQEDAA